MKELIKSIFQNFTVDNVQIPVKLLYYKGHGEPYVIFLHEDSDNSFAGDDNLLGYVEYYDFDVYSTGNIEKIIERIKELLTANGFVYQPARSGSDMYEVDTGYYHKTLNFAYQLEV